MNLSKLMIGCVALSSANLSALCLTNNVEFSTGYRQDDFKISERIQYDPTSESFPVPEIARNWETTLRHVNIWQVGGKFRVIFPELDCCYDNCGCGFDWGFLRNFYLKGFGYWGTDIGNTRFKDTFKLTEETDEVPFDEAPAYGLISNYRTIDWQIGLGYLIDLGSLCGCNDLGLGLGIVGGYSWHEQKTKTKHSVGSIFFSPCECTEAEDVLAIIDDSAYHGQKWKNKWHGGFLGAELFYQTCDILFNLGYEYHWANWQANVDPASEVEGTEGFVKERRKQKNAHGNVVYLDTTYYLCDCWDIGLGLKYAYYKADHGHVHLDDPDPGVLSYTASHARGSWQTWQVTANVGYNW